MAKIAMMAGEGLTWSSRALPCLLAIVSFGVLLLGQVEATRSDSCGTLVVSQSIIKNGTVRLHRYEDFFRGPNRTDALTGGSSAEVPGTGVAGGHAKRWLTLSKFLADINNDAAHTNP